MSFRFRYLRPGGQEAQVESLEGLTELLQRGEILPDTLLYDALTGEWAPLRAHAVGRLLLEVDGRAVERGPADGDDPSARSEQGRASGDPEDAPASGAVSPPPSGAGFELPDMTLTLADADVSGPSTEEAVRELLKERQQEESAGGGAFSFTAAPAGADGLVLDAGLQPREPPPAEPPPAEPPPSAVREPAPRRAAKATRPAAPAAASPREPVRVPVTAPARSSARRGLAATLMAAGSAGLLALLVYAVAWSDDEPDAPYEVPVVTAAAAPAQPLRSASAATLLGVSETVALADMVEALEGLRMARDLDRVPTDWLEGVYLANAGDYPEVREYWERYAAFVDEVRQRDTALFRQSFVRRLEAQGVTGPLVPMRLARAVRAFEQSAPARDTVYAAMEYLARASLDLHDLLVDRADDIVYDPVRPNRVSRDPVVEAVTDDAALRTRMWALLDRIFLSLEVMSGGQPGTRDALTARSLDGIRATGGL